MFGVGLGNFTSYRAAHIDGVRLDAHNLEGAILGEAGALGVLCFGLLILATLINCGKVRQLAAMHDDNELAVLAQLAWACRDVLILLLLLGQVSYNLQRFNWLWMAAFCLLAATFARGKHSEIGILSTRTSTMQ